MQSKHKVKPTDNTVGSAGSTVFSAVRTIECPIVDFPPQLKINSRLKMDGQKFLSLIPANSIPVVFFDPQYRGVLDKMRYGNKGKNRGRERSDLPQMNETVIKKFIGEIARILIPSGHLFLWVDKFHLCQGVSNWFEGTNLDVVDMVTWNKKKMEMGYRTRRCSEYLIILQTLPRRAKNVWKVHNILDVWEEPVKSKNGHTHRKPVKLQSRLITAVSNENDVIVDPAAGSFSVMESANNAGRNFLGCDING